MDFDYHILIRSTPLLLSGLGWTMLIATTAITGGTGLGLGLCGMGLSDAEWARWCSRSYIEFFRTTPEMVLIFWVYFCFPPLLDLRLSAFWSGTLALTLVSGAYLAEIFRAGIQSVDAGQMEAAEALGLKWHHRWGLIILPQAFRRMLPAIMAYLTELLKNTALLSAIRGDGACLPRQHARRRDLPLYGVPHCGRHHLLRDDLPGQPGGPAAGAAACATSIAGTASAVVARRTVLGRGVQRCTTIKTKTRNYVLRRSPHSLDSQGLHRIFCSGAAGQARASENNRMGSVAMTAILWTTVTWTIAILIVISTERLMARDGHKVFDSIHFEFNHSLCNAFDFCAARRGFILFWAVVCTSGRIIPKIST